MKRIFTAARSSIGRLFFCALLAAVGCVHTESRAAPGAVRTVRHPRGARVWIRLGQVYRRNDKPRVKVDQGTIEELAVSPDRRTVSLLWVNPGGTLVCAFPIYGAVRVTAGEWEQPVDVEYVFLKEGGVEVTARRPKQIPSAAQLAVSIRLPESSLPARLHREGSKSIGLTRSPQTVSIKLPVDLQGFLEEADTPFVIHTADGREHWFLVGVDPDGGIAAVTGFVRNW